VLAKVWTDFLAVISANADRLAARMTEQTVKDLASVEMLDWKKIQAGQNLAINVDAQAFYAAEKRQLQGWIDSKDVGKIISRYPIRETPALGAIVSGLQFKGRPQYEAAVRKMASEDSAKRQALIQNFGGFAAAIA
jgi:hypothetical protein